MESMEKALLDKMGRKRRRAEGRGFDAGELRSMD
jgi:hypothetical protein